MNQLKPVSRSNLHVILSTVGDSALYEEVARRMKDAFQKMYGVEFCTGTFEFVFQESEFKGVEPHPEFKPFMTPERPKPVPA